MAYKGYSEICNDVVLSMVTYNVMYIVDGVLSTVTYIVRVDVHVYKCKRIHSCTVQAYASVTWKWGAKMFLKCS